MFTVPEYTIRKPSKIKQINAGINLIPIIAIPIYIYYTLHNTKSRKWCSDFDLYQFADPRFSMYWYMLIWMLLTTAIICSFIKNWNFKKIMMLWMFTGVYSVHIYVDIIMRIHNVPRNIGSSIHF